MKLSTLIKGIPALDVKGPKDIAILGLCNHSKKVAPGDLFFAKKGLTQHGYQFISDAVLAGAVAIATDLFDPFLFQSKKVVQLIHPDVAALESLLAKRFYSIPPHCLFKVGITGTNGKTTCSYLIKHLFEGKGMPMGLIGTIEWIIKENVFPSTLTTPDQLTLRKLFYEMVSAECSGVVMEVSSHALDQGRVEGFDFDIAVFTNLTQDHLDYHETLQEYANAKSKLFASLDKGKIAILNGDSPWLPQMRRDLKASAMTYGLVEGVDLRAEDLVLRPDGTSFQVRYRGQKATCTTSLIGKFNVYNCLVAIGAGLSRGWELKEILEILSSFTQGVPGRLERITDVRGKNIFVDYAHTEDALKNVLETLREVVKKGRIFCVFGCGGNRDRLKRPKMGAIAQQYADEVFVTSDNPRGEDPQEIIQEILQGMERSLAKVHIEVDRKKAIGQAIEHLQEEDVLLIAGKGHENYQIFSHHTIHFDDRIIAKEYCR